MHNQTKFKIIFSNNLFKIEFERLCYKHIRQSLLLNEFLVYFIVALDDFYCVKPFE